jgi:hypothetical protein
VVRWPLVVMVGGLAHSSYRRIRDLEFNGIGHLLISLYFVLTRKGTS